MTDTRRALRNSSFVQLSLTNLRELTRDPVAFLIVLVMPFLFLGMFALISTFTSGGTTDVGVVSSTGQGEQRVLLRSLTQTPGLRVTPLPAVEGRRRLDAGRLDVLVSLRGSAIDVDVAKDKTAAGAVVSRALTDATRGAEAPQVSVHGSGEAIGFGDPVRFGIPAVLVLGFTSLAFFGTATPLIQLRRQGTLRLLGLTPVARATFVAAQVPARLGIGLVQLALMMVVARATGHFKLGQLTGCLLTALIGLLMLFSLGYLLGGLIRSPEAGAGALAAINPVVLMFSGVLLPLALLPDVLRTAARALPFTYLGDGLRQQLVGSAGTFSLTVDRLALLVATLVFTALTVRTFRWDQGESA